MVLGCCLHFSHGLSLDAVTEAAALPSWSGRGSGGCVPGAEGSPVVKSPRVECFTKVGFCICYWGGSFILGDFSRWTSHLVA